MVDGVRTVIVIDWHPPSGATEVTSQSSHRSLGHEFTDVYPERNAPVAALIELARRIAEAETRWAGIPDG